jgi:hypothetical protein
MKLLETQIVQLRVIFPLNLDLGPAMQLAQSPKLWLYQPQYPLELGNDTSPN